jgi:DNA (cytosine-5)-methyltransferase 1
MFGLPLLKHRLFETSWDTPEPLHNRHTGSVGNGDYITVAGHGGNNKTGNFQIKVWQKAMGIDWMYTQHDLAEAIPPSYTKYVGEQWLKNLI